jgi:hypothetical protein
VLNWSWWGDVATTDQYYTDLGFKQIYGNLDLLGPDAGGGSDAAGRKLYEEWSVRSAAPGVLGGETSSWSTWGDFGLGRLHYPSALHTANLLWSSELPPREQADAAVAHELPRLRDRMQSLPVTHRVWSVATPAASKHPISIRPACNAPLSGGDWDLSGLRPGRQEHDGLPLEIVDPAQHNGLGAVVVARAGAGSEAAPIPVGGAYASLIFWQVATESGDRPIPPYNTAYPREGAELLGWYEVRYADGLVGSAEIRYGENLRAWNEGHALPYHAHEVTAGRRADGSPLVIWGLEWTNPRPSIPIASVTLRGARPSPETRRQGHVSQARPLLLGITAVELPKLEDC